ADRRRIPGRGHLRRGQPEPDGARADLPGRPYRTAGDRRGAVGPSDVGRRPPAVHEGDRRVRIDRTVSTDPLDALPPERRRHLRRSRAEWMQPMLATLTEDRFSDPGWIFETKLD